MAPPRLPARARHRRHPATPIRRRSACILGGHGITAWGDTSDEAEANSLWIIDTAAEYIAAHGRPEPFGAAVAAYAPLPEAERRAKAAALAPHDPRARVALTGRWSGTSPTPTRCSTSSPQPSTRGWPALGTCCPDHFLRTKVKPLVLDLPSDATVEESVARLRELHVAYRDDYQGYYDRHATPTPRPIRGADPAIVLVPGRGHVHVRREQADRPGRAASSTSTRST